MKSANCAAGKQPRARSSLRRALAATLAVLLLGLAYLFSNHFHLHQQLYQLSWTWFKGDRAPGRNIWLPDYHVTIDAKPVAPGLENLSGVTYDYDQDRLLAVTNKGPKQILVLSKDGDILAQYPLEGFDDTEGLAYLGNGRIAVADESLQQLDIITLPEQPRTIAVEEAQFIALLINPTHSNKGFEGVTYDAANDRLFAIKERDPRQLFEVTGVMRSIDQGKLQIKVIDRQDWIDNSVYARDLSDGYYDPRTGHLLILSDQSRSITELDASGKFVSVRSLVGALSDLQHSAPQPEGMTMDRDGNLYVVSEPNLFYKFTRQPR
ncbi:SdiA-regulated domain-containing protein [Pseudomonas putida]|uniref:SdiA-regulated domain-containing protein n=1 Tax=Pseudomonas putida TaxID=303 RepID=UPI003CC805B9